MGLWRVTSRPSSNAGPLGVVADPQPNVVLPRRSWEFWEEQ